MLQDTAGIRSQLEKICNKSIPEPNEAFVLVWLVSDVRELHEKAISLPELMPGSLF